MSERKMTEQDPRLAEEEAQHVIPTLDHNELDEEDDFFDEDEFYDEDFEEDDYYDDTDDDSDEDDFDEEDDFFDEYGEWEEVEEEDEEDEDWEEDEEEWDEELAEDEEDEDVEEEWEEGAEEEEEEEEEDWDEEEEDDELDEEEVEDVEEEEVEETPPGGITPEDPGWVLSFEGWRGYVLVFGVAFLVYAMLTGNRIGQLSDNPHYVFLADSLLRGRWHLDGPPIHPVTEKPLNNDWAYYYVVTLKNNRKIKGMFRGRRQGKRVFRTLDKKIVLVQRKDIKSWKKRYYVSFPPLPAFLMMPGVWLYGHFYGDQRIRYSDITFNLFFAALAVMLMFLLLQHFSRQGRSPRTLRENLLLTALFAFGTVFFYVAVQGTVWFSALVLGACCTLLYLRLALGARHPFWAGLLLGMAFLCRPLLLLTGIFFLWELFHRNEEKDLSLSSDKLQKLALFALPVLAIGGAMMYVNDLRFENVFEFGHTYLPAVYHKTLRYGLFHPHWLPRNFYATFLAPPYFLNQYPYIKVNAHGLSIFLTTPAFFLLFWSQRRTATFRGLLFCVLVLLLPMLFYQNTGWLTFGNRFSVDYTPYLILMLAVAARPIDGLFRLLLWLGILVNTFGAITFGRLWKFYHTPYNSLDWWLRIFR